MLLIGNGKLITRDPENSYYERGAVVCDGEFIKEIGNETTLKAKYPKAEFLDAHGGIIMPGLINAHTHIYSGLARGLSIKGYSPVTFWEVLDGMWWKIDRHLDLEMTRASAYCTIIDCIKMGVTTIFDHHASFKQIPGSLFAIKDVAGEMGIRACLCYEVSDRDGKEKCLESIRENTDFAQWAKTQDDDMIKAMFGGHALFTISDKTFEQMAEANNGMTGFHIHVCEGRNDVEDSHNVYHMRPIDRLQKHGILGPKTILGHCIHLEDEELDVVAETDTMIVNNPESNMGNAVGCSPVLDIYKKGILVGLGTDAYTHDMMESLKVALIIQRHNTQKPNVGWCEVTDMLFRKNAAIGARYFSRPLGVLRPGAAADIAVFDYRPFTPFSESNVDGHIIFGFEGRQCIHTIINGQVLMKDRELTRVDEAEINTKVCENAVRLWNQLNK